MGTSTVIQTGWNFDNSYSNLPKSFFTIVDPTPVSDPKLIVFNDSLADFLGLNSMELKSRYGAEVFAGNEIPKGALPLAEAYGGHQFGYFTMLGDGRAILIGEQITPQGERFDIQLKGSGRTPYSRRGDGRAVLGPMLREFIISEAMYGLGIPTTRSLAVVITGEKVYRETNLPGAILTRVASSHIRVGTFQYASRLLGIRDVKHLADYILNRHYKDILSSDEPYLLLLREVIKRQASLIAKWMLVGFVHGVMNTDNMAISGETIDYGPCAFIDIYNPDTVFSSIDTRGRYAYGKQPDIAAWNLARFAETLLPLLHDNEDKAIKIAEDEIYNFNKLYHQNLITGMRAKLGIFNKESEDETLVKDFLNLMHKHKSDYTNTFLALTFNKKYDLSLVDTIEFIQWYQRWQARLKRQEQSKEKVHQLMKNSNPAIIPRNHRVEEALDAAQDENYDVMNKLLKALSDPYAHSLEQTEYSIIPDTKNCSYRTFCGT